MPAPALVLDEQGLVCDANALALALTGCARDQLLGRSVGEVLEGRAADGTPVRLRALRSLQRDGTTLCLLREVRGDELVEDVASHFDAAFHHAPIGMAVIGADGRYVRVNDALCAMLDRSRPELVGARDNELTHPDDRARDVELAWRVLRGELDSVVVEKRFVRRDGAVVWVIANMTYLRDDAGSGIAWVGQWQDVTAHRAVEAELRRQRDLSAAMLAATHEGFCLVVDDVVVQVNDALCELVGWAREEIVGARWPFPWIPDGELARHAAMRRRWSEPGRGETDDVSLRRRDGGCFPASLTSALATAPDGEALGWVMTVRDISERKRQEAELARQATIDTLTGLANHRAFHERLREEVSRSRRHGAPLSLAILDLDHFKHVNDTFGHPAGDRVLAEVGRRFRSLSRTDEQIARIGGEEFGWLLPGATGAEAYAAAERARRAIGGRRFDGVGELTVSVGVCELGEEGDAGELQRLADLALYWAKDHGRNVVMRYAPSGDELDPASGARASADEQALRLRALHAVARSVEQGHPSSDGHAERVAQLAALIAARLGWSAAQVRLLREASVLHDVGKVVVPKSVLLKPGPFDASEWAQMRTHPSVGDDMLEGLLTPAQRAWVRGHHERWDGRGYPDELSGREIPEGARILAVADSWDVMTSVRVYGGALSRELAIAELRRESGEQFDPRAAGALVELLESALAPAALGGGVA